MENIFLNMLSYTFLTRAAIVGVLVSLCASLLGTSLVLKRYSMIGDGLSHVGFGALAVATVLNFSPLVFTVPIVSVTAVLLLKMSQNGKLKGDSAIALISSSSLAIGIFAVSVKNGTNVDVNNYMFGSILALNNIDTIISIILSLVVICLYAVFYNRIFSVTFDEEFARATGTNSKLYNTIIAVLTAVTVVLGMRMMGALLISCLIIFPPVSAMCICKTFKSVVICSSVISVICFITGITASTILGTPVGASVVIVNLMIFLILRLVAFFKYKGE